MKTILLLSLVAASSALAATRTWTGSGANTNWTTAANWSGSVAPVAGDTLEFPVVGTTLNSVNNFPADTSFGGILISAAGYTISGNPITLNGDLLYNYTGTSQFTCVIRFKAAHTIQGDGVLNIDSVDVEGPTLSFNPTSGAIIVNGSLAGTGDITKLGSGRLTLLRDCSGFSGALHIDAGELDVYHSDALAGAHEVVFSSAALGLFGSTPLNIARSLVFIGSSQILVADSAHTISGDVEFNSISPFVVQTVNTGSPTLNLAGSVTGNGDLQVIGAVTFSGTVDNTFSGVLRITGTATLSKTAGRACATHGIVVTPNSSCILNADDQVRGPLNVQSGATMTFNDHALNVTDFSMVNGTLDTGTGTLTITGTVSQAGGNATINGALNCTASAQTWSIGNVSTETCTVNASVSFPTGATMSRAGLGRLVLNSGTNLVALTHSQGITILNGANTLLNVSLQGGTLGGSGAINSVTQASSLSSHLAPGDNIGALKMDRFSWGAFTAVDIELNGVAQGSGYDAIVTTGSTTGQLSSASLNVALGPNFAAPVNTKFRIIDQRGTALLGGTFTGKANNSTFVVGAYTFRINYLTGSGNNDVELTVTAGPFTTTSRTWTGAGANALWSNAANWSGGVAPNPGDNLTFPASSSQFTTTNDFTAGTFFNAITTLGSYTHSGNAVTVAGMTCSPGAAGFITSNIDIAVSAGTPALSSGSGFWMQTGHVTADGGAVTINSSTGATMQVAGVISGSDSFSKIGSGILALSSANDFTGEFTMNAGTLNVGNGTALGSIVAGTRLLGGSCMINGPLTLSEPLELNAACALSITGGSSTLFSTITTSGSAGQTCFITVGGGILAVFTGAISGPVGIMLNGGGSALINGSASNTFADKLTVDLPLLTLSKTASNPDAVPFGTQLVVENNRVVTLGGGNQIAGSVRLKAGATLNLNGFNEALNTLDMEGFSTVNTGAGLLTLAGTLHAYNAASTINGKLEIAGTCTLTVDDSGSPDDLTINAIISDASLPNLIRNGPGRLVLTAANTFTTMRLDAGDTAINATNSALALTLNGGKLSGTGSVASITSAAGGGIIAPGASAGLFNAGSLNLNAATTVQLELNGLTAGSGHDQLVTSTAANNLGGATLQFTLGFSPVIGNSFKLISNSSTTGGTSGTFAGLPEGAAFVFGPYVFRINYNTGTNNNDTVLTYITQPAPVLTSQSITNGPGIGIKSVQMSGTCAFGAVAVFQESFDLVNWSSITNVTSDATGHWSFNLARPAAVPQMFFRVLIP